MPDSFRGWTQAVNVTQASSVAGSMPTGTQSTDVVFAFVYWDFATAPDTPAAPSGWTMVEVSPSNGGLKGALYWAPGSASAPTFQFSSSGTPTVCYNGVDLGGYAGGDATTPYVNADFAVVWDASGTGSPVASLAIQVQNANWFVCGFAPYSVSNQTYSTPIGLTQRSSSSPMAWFDSNGSAAGANVTASTTGSFSGNYVGFALSLNPLGGGGGAPVAQATLLGQNLGYSGTSPTVTNSLAAIPSGAYLRLRASDTGFAGIAGTVTAVSGGGLTWTQLHDSGDQANGSNHIRQSVWAAVASSSIAQSALTVTATHTVGGASPNSSLDLVMVTGADGVDVSAAEDSVVTGTNQSAGIAVTGAQAGDLLLAAIMGYATDSGGLGVVAGKLQTLIGLSTPTTTPPVETWVALNGPTGVGVNEVEVNWGNTGGAGQVAPYIAWAEAFSPQSVSSSTPGVVTSAWSQG